MLRNPDTLAAAQAVDPPKSPTFNGWQNTISHLLGACLVCALIFLGERFFIQLISINYHRKQFAAKIKDNKRNVYLLGLLYDASRTLFPAYCNEFMEEDHIINDSLNLSSLAGSNKGSGARTPLKLLRNVGRMGDNVASVFGNIASEIAGKEVLNPNSAHSIVIEALEKKRACEALARRLWMSFVVEGRDALFEEDVVEVLGHDRREDAIECFGVFDRDGNGDVTLEEAILTVTEIGRDRKSLANSMHDVDQAINVLDSLLSTVVFIVAIFVFVAFLNASFTTTLATAGTALLSLSFVFAATTQEVLGSCIFLFVKHPYDIGDRVDLTTGTDQLVVEHISLLFTIFKRVNTGKMVQIPNIVLNNLWVENISRSKAMREQLSIYCDFGTSFEDVQSLKEEMTKFVTAKENTRDFQSEVDIEVLGFDKMNQMELRIEIKHKSNWANESVRAMRRSKFMCALVLALRRVPIYGPGGGDPGLGSANNPSYSVAISPEVAQNNKDSWTETKDAKRLYPTIPSTAKSTGSDLSGNTANEVNAMHQLSQRQPNRDARDDVWGSGDDSVSSLSDRGNSMDRERASLDEVRGLLKRESTRGRRHQQQGGLSPIEEPYSPPMGVPPSRTQYAPMPSLSPVSNGSGIGSPAPTALPSQRGLSPASGPVPYVPGNAFSAHPPNGPTPLRPARSSSISQRNVPPSGPLPSVPGNGTSPKRSP
jgi:Mechanosensitive ion channel